MANKAIGGFFELELPTNGSSYHPQALALCTGRACLGLALDTIRPTRVHVPFYTCDALVEPILLRRIPYTYYALNERLEPATLPRLQASEIFIYINYFGIKSQYTSELRQLFREGLLVDNTHDFFHRGFEDNWSFTSARKYFGVPDGAYLYSPSSLGDDPSRFTGISVEHSLNRLLGDLELGYRQYVEYEKSLDSTIQRISLLSESLLSQVPYDRIRDRRRDNFNFLHRELGADNQLAVDLNEDSNAFCYPFLPAHPLAKSELHAHRFFIPSFWRDTLSRDTAGFELEKKFSEELLPLPIDHRYTDHDLTLLSTFIRRLLAAT